MAALHGLFAAFSILTFSPVDESATTGIFLTIECRKDLPRKHGLITAKPVCLMQSPIIYPKDFGSISPLKETGTNVQFDLSFTPKGHQTLVKLVASMPDAGLALVVNDDVFFVFRASELRVSPTFRFQTPIKYRSQVESVHRQLVEILESASGDL
jgi:hypothetical protein